MMRLSTLVAFLALVLPCQASTQLQIALRGSDDRRLQQGLEAYIVNLVNGILSGQLGTINSNLQSAVSDPLAIAISGTSSITLDGVTSCSGVSAAIAYNVDKVSGTKTTTVNNITLGYFGGLAFNLCGALALGDSNINAVTTGKTYTIAGTGTISANSGACVQTNAITFATTISDTIYKGTATIAGGGSGSFKITKATLSSFTTTVGTVTTVVSGLDSSLSSLTTTIQDTINTEVKSKLADTLNPLVKGFFETALNSLVGARANMSDRPSAYSRWNLSKMWVESTFGV